MTSRRRVIESRIAAITMPIVSVIASDAPSEDVRNALIAWLVSAGNKAA